MTTENNQPASAEPIEPKTAQPLEEPKTQEPPASEQPEEWDKERAAATIKAQREKEKELKAQLKDYERLKAEEKERLDAQLTETERLKKQADELKATNAKLQSDILRRDVIAETGLPAAFAKRLKGSTKEELIADANELKKLLPKTNPNIAPTNPSGANPNETEAQKRERLFGRNTGVFDVQNILENGGGVIWPDKKE